jgi:hypothetical protein
MITIFISNSESVTTVDSATVLTLNCLELSPQRETHPPATAEQNSNTTQLTGTATLRHQYSVEDNSNSSSSWKQLGWNPRRKMNMTLKFHNWYVQYCIHIQVLS